MRSKWLRNRIRAFAYGSRLDRFLGIEKKTFDREYWNGKLSGDYKPWLGNTISVETRNSIVTSLIARLAPNAGRVLDVGCASGSLFRALGKPDLFYVGVDISDYAVNEGRRLSPEAEFFAEPLEKFSTEDVFDVVILNEVLYFLSVDRAIHEIGRYLDYLADDGILIISMKDDPKSKAIFLEAKKSASWVNGVLYQEKIDGPEFKIRKDSARPGYMVGVFSPSSSRKTI